MNIYTCPRYLSKITFDTYAMDFHGHRRRLLTWEFNKSVIDWRQSTSQSTHDKHIRTLDMLIIPLNLVNLVNLSKPYHSLHKSCNVNKCLGHKIPSHLELAWKIARSKTHTTTIFFWKLDTICWSLYALEDIARLNEAKGLFGKNFAFRILLQCALDENFDEERSRILALKTMIIR